MTEQDKIEIFTGGISDLERMTSRDCLPITNKNGMLQRIVVLQEFRVGHYSPVLLSDRLEENITILNSQLREKAFSYGADAVVNVSYITNFIHIGAHGFVVRYRIPSGGQIIIK